MAIIGLDDETGLFNYNHDSTTLHVVFSAAAFTYVAPANEEVFRFGVYCGRIDGELGLYDITGGTAGAPVPVATAAFVDTDTAYSWLTVDIAGVALTSGNTYGVAVRTPATNGTTGLSRAFSNDAVTNHATLVGSDDFGVWADGGVVSQRYAMYAETRVIGAAGGTVDSVNGGSPVLDGATGVTGTHSNFPATPTGLILRATDGASLNFAFTPANFSADATTYTFDAPDVAAIVAATAGIPYTSTAFTISAELTDGTDTHALNFVYNPATGRAKIDAIAPVVTTAGSYFEGFTTTILSNDQVDYPTASNTDIDANGIITSDLADNSTLAGKVFRQTDGQWIQHAVIFNPSADVTPPTAISATANADGTITIDASEALQVGAGGNTGFTASLSGGATTLTIDAAVGPTAILTSSRPLTSADTGTIDFTQPGNGLQDLAVPPNDMATFITPLTLVNNIPVADNAPTGLPAITGPNPPMVGLFNTADYSAIADTDGLTWANVDWEQAEYQWLSGTTPITDARNRTFASTAAQLAAGLAVDITFDDDLGNTYTLRSALTANVVVNPATPIDRSMSVKPFILFGGDPLLTAADIPVLARHEIVLLARKQYDDINGDTRNEVGAVSPDTEIYLYQDGPSVADNKDAFPLADLNNIGRYDVSRGHPGGSLNGSHSAWFLENAAAQRLNTNGFINDWRLDFGAAGFQDYSSDAAINDHAKQPYHSGGIYFDNMVVSNPSELADVNLVPSGYTTAALHDGAMNGYTAKVSADFHARGIKFAANRGNSRFVDGLAAWQALDALADQPDWAIEEGFAAVSWGPQQVQFYEVADWLRQVSLPGLISNSSVVMMSHTDLTVGQSGTGITGAVTEAVTYEQILRFSVGSYLLSRRATGPQTYFSFTDDRAVQEYNRVVDPTIYEPFDVGDPTADYQAVPNSNLYFRPFTKGVVYVNPTGAVETDVPRVDSAGLITIAAHDAVISDIVEENLFTFSEEADNGIWTKTGLTVTSDTGTPPTGFTVADTLVEDGTVAGLHYERTTFPGLADNQNITFVKRFEAINRDYLYLQCRNKAFVTASATYRASTGLISGSSGGLAYTIVDLGAGWYECSLSLNTGSGGGTVQYDVFIAEGNNDVTFDGLNQDSLRVTGDQLNRGIGVATYIPVPAIDEPPVLDPIGPQTGDEGQILTFTVTASDAESTPVLSATNMPTGATFNPATGVFDWMPDYGDADASPYSVTFSADDGVNTPVTEIVQITVNEIDRPPTGRGLITIL